MGLMSKLKEVVHSISDMGQMTKLQDHLTEHIETLHADGICPEAVWTAYEQFKTNGEAVKAEKDNNAASKMSIAALHAFLEVLEQNEDQLPEDFKSELEKYANVEREVEHLTKMFVN